MSDLAIRVEDLSKAYRIGLKELRHETLLGALASVVRSPFENYRNLRKFSHFDDILAEDGSARLEEATSLAATANGRVVSQSQTPNDVLWALRRVSFDVKRGEVLGIIGSNGAGKSTLLKVLSRITEPTTGRAHIYGRVGSLLEVGTGFHPDLTGRENIYLNGTILGMKKREIDARFDEIVAFSGVERFIDTPVKRFSSGMRVRLAFSVAAHLEPEILVIDEVLAVGDLNFQKKCLGKMNEVAAQGRTVLFVSHNLGSVKELCQTGLLLENGQVAYRGEVLDAIVRYSRLLEETDETEEASAPRSRNSWQNVRLVNRAGLNSNRFDNSEPIALEASLRLSDRLESPKLICRIDGSDGLLLVHDSPLAAELACILSEPGLYHVRIVVPPLWVAPDAYSIHVKLVGTTVGARYVTEPSPRLLLDVTDQGHAHTARTRARLAPHTTWTVERST